MENFDPAKSDRFMGLYELRNKETGERRIVAQLVEPFELYDIKTNEHFYEFDANRFFQHYTYVPYVSCKDKIKKWLRRFSKCPLRLAWIVMLCFVSFISVLLYIAIPAEWLLCGRVYSPRKFFYFIYAKKSYYV